MLCNKCYEGRLNKEKNISNGEVRHGNSTYRAWGRKSLRVWYLESRPHRCEGVSLHIFGEETSEEVLQSPGIATHLRATRQPRMIREGDCDFRDGDNDAKYIESPVGIFQDWNTWYEIELRVLAEGLHDLASVQGSLLCIFIWPRTCLEISFWGLSHSPYKLWSSVVLPQTMYHHGSTLVCYLNGWDFHLPVIFSISQYLYILHSAQVGVFVLFFFFFGLQKLFSCS